MKISFKTFGFVSVLSIGFAFSVSADEEGVSFHRPVVSPDGKSIVFMSSHFSNDWELFFINLDGTGLKRLTNHPGWDGYAAFGPKRTFTYDREDGEPKKDGSSKTPYVYDLETGKTWPFLEMEGVWATVNDWSPDRQKAVLFIDKEGQRDLYLTDAEGQNLEQITDTPDTNEHDAQFSPDGTKLAYAYQKGDETGFNIMDLKTGEISPMATSNQRIYGLAWSPDGTRIAYTDTPHDNPDGNAEIYVMDVSNREITQLTQNDDYDHMPRWITNSEIIFTSYATGIEQIYTLDLEAGEVKNFLTGLE